MGAEVLHLKLADCMGFMERTRKYLPGATLHAKRRSLLPAQQDVTNRIRDLTELQITASLYNLQPGDDEQEQNGLRSNL